MCAVCAIIEKIKTDKIINPQDGIYFKGEGFAVNKVESNKIYPNKMINLQIGDELWRNFDSEFEKELLKPVKRQIGLTIEVKEKITITDEDGISITKELPTGEPANSPEKMKETFIKQFSKTGDSDFYIENISIETELPFIPILSNYIKRKKSCIYRKSFTI